MCSFRRGVEARGLHLSRRSKDQLSPTLETILTLQSQLEAPCNKELD